MSIKISSHLEHQFNLFRQGRLSVEDIQTLLLWAGSSFKQQNDEKYLYIIEQANARIDFILWGVCEAERDAHINELLQEIEAKLAP